MLQKVTTNQNLIKEGNPKQLRKVEQGRILWEAIKRHVSEQLLGIILVRFKGDSIVFNSGLNSKVSRVLL